MPLQKKKSPMRKFQDRIIFQKGCKYIGSVAITLLNGEERQHFVNEKLLEMKDVGKGVPVVLVITDEGIKVLKQSESAVKMAHGITRIAFSTCQPERRLFAYVAKSFSVDKKELIQAHMFKTKKNVHSQQLSLNLSKSFKMAYAKNTTKRKNRVQLFEIEAKEQQDVSDIQSRGKRWAKVEMAHGHEYSGHAVNARNSHSSDVNRLIADLCIDDTPTLPLTQDLNRKDDLCDNVFNAAPQNPNKKETSMNQISNEEKVERNNNSISLKNNVDVVEDNKHRPKEKKKEFKSISEDQNSMESLNITTDCSSAKKHGFVSPVARFSDVINNDVDLQSYQNVVLGKDGYHVVDLTAQEYIQQVDAKNNEIPHTCSVQMDVSRLTMTEEELMKDSEWFQPGFSREIAETILQNRSIGSFFIRESTSHLDSYVMTVKVPAHMKPMGVANFLLERVDGSFRIKGFSAIFATLTDLVAHYGTVQEDIPCRLRLAHDNPLFLRRQYIDQPDAVNKTHNEHEDVDSDEYEDPDYENFDCNEDIMRELSLMQS